MRYSWIRGKEGKSIADYTAELDDAPTTPGDMMWVPCPCLIVVRGVCEVCSGTGRMLTTLRIGAKTV